MRIRLAPFLSLLAAAIVAAFLFATLAMAQTEVRADLEKARSEITALDREVTNRSEDDRALAGLRGQLDPIVERLRGVIGEQTPRLEGIKARLEQLGPKPDPAKNQQDNPDVAREREEQEKALRDTEALLALARNHIVAAEQLSSRIVDQRRSLLTKALLERTSSVFSPVLWLNVARALPGEWSALERLLGQASGHFIGRLDTTTIGSLTLALLILGIVAIPGHRYLQRFEGRPAVTDTPPSRQQKALAALRVMAIWAVVPAIVSMGLYNLIEVLNLLPDRLDGVMKALLFGVAFVAFAHGMADGILAPEDPGWRLVVMDNRTASRLANLAGLFPAIVVTGKVLEALNQAIYAILPVTVGTKAVFALLGALALIRALRLLRGTTEEGMDGVSVAPSLHPALRLGGWMAAVTILTAVTFGYVALGSFLQDQVIWLAMIAAVVILLVALIDEFVGHGVSPDGAAGKQIMAQVGLSRSSLQQISILSNGFLRLVLFIAAAMFVMAPWGLDQGDTMATFRAALFGFTVGGVTISFSSIVVAIALLLIGFTVTRGIKRWLEKTYLPATKLDVGLRNSIATSIGYLGIIIATMLAASTLGLSLDKFTIVAGALSVGIGFGLQSIVNNFVSGLILLWERPIRVGDWIVVGEEQGIVKRINVRSTQIETFDRASLIVPNAEFISGRVKNWMHNDRTARIVIPIGVGYGSDPEKVRKLLLEVAKASKDVLKDPPPRVYFMRMSDTSMDFELRCFADVDQVLPVKSELLFQIHRQLTKARIDIPLPRRPRELLDEDDSFDQKVGGQALDTPADTVEALRSAPTPKARK